MSTAMHSPKPWHFIGAGGYERKRTDGTPWRSLSICDNDNRVVAEVAIKYGGKWSDPEALANRDLIAAAPDLLAALDSLRHAVEHEGAHGRMVQAVVNARAAIAKAKGLK